MIERQDWTRSYRRLWKRLVPRRGQAETVQGELLRCVGKLTDEAYRNGNQNWDENFELMARFVGETLDDPAVFGTNERAKIRRAVARIIAKPDSPDISGRGSSYYYLAEQATTWCEHRRAPIARKINPDLQK